MGENSCFDASKIMTPPKPGKKRLPIFSHILEVEISKRDRPVGIYRAFSQRSTEKPQSFK